MLEQGTVWGGKRPEWHCRTYLQSIRVTISDIIMSIKAQWREEKLEKTHFASEAFQHWQISVLPSHRSQQQSQVPAAQTNRRPWRRISVLPEAAATEFLCPYGEQSTRQPCTDIALSASSRGRFRARQGIPLQIWKEIFQGCCLSPRNRFLTWPYLMAETTAVK